MVLQPIGCIIDFTNKHRCNPIPVGTCTTSPLFNTCFKRGAHYEFKKGKKKLVIAGLIFLSINVHEMLL